MEQVIIVDADDVVIGSKGRSELEFTDIVRVSALWATDNKGDILLARRAENKETNPGKWGPAVAGTNEAGETYIENIMRETQEEIGAKLSNFKPLTKVLESGSHGPMFVQWFCITIDKNTALKPQKSEVAELGWFSKEDLAMLLQEMPDMFIDTAVEHWPSLFLR